MHLLPSFSTVRRHFLHSTTPMAWAINAPADQYTSYSLAAKSVTGTPVKTSSVVLSGAGAVATSPPFTPTPSVLPVTSATSSSVIPPSTTTSSSSALPSETSASPSKSSSNNGAAIGGGVGGAVAVCILALLAFLLFRTRRQRAANTGAPHGPESGEKYDTAKGSVTPQGPGMNNVYQGDPFAGAAPVSFLQYDRTGSSRGLANMDGGPVAAGENYGQQHVLNGTTDNPYSRNTTYTQGSSVLSGPPSEPALSGGLPGHEFGVRAAEAPNMNFHPQPQYPTAVQSSNMGVHEIAKEVATLLGPHLRNTSTPASASPPPGLFRALPNPHANLKLNQDNEPPKSPGPPQYNQYDRN